MTWRLLTFVFLFCLLQVESIRVTTRKQTLQNTGRIRWSINENEIDLIPSQTAIIVVDMWDRHWCPSATERVASLAILINQTISSAREMGVNIIHAPSMCSGFYSSTPARQYVLSLPNITLPNVKPLPVPTLPIQADDQGCDVPGASQQIVWTRQIESITIDQTRDSIIDDELDGQTLWNIINDKGLKYLLYLGVHENMCIMTRSFALEKTVAWGLQTGLFREAIDTMYDPSQSPYVSHQTANDLMTAYIEKFWSFSLSIYDFINPRVQNETIPRILRNH